MSTRTTDSPWSPSRWLDRSSILLFLALWELTPRAGGLLETFIAPPSLVLRTLGDLFMTGELCGHVAVSLGRAGAGFLVAVLFALPLGFLLGGNFRSFERIVHPILKFFGNVNPFSLFPLFILLFGIGEISKCAMIFWVCIWPILFSTITGVQGIDPRWSLR